MAFVFPLCKYLGNLAVFWFTVYGCSTESHIHHVIEMTLSLHCISVMCKLEQLLEKEF